MYAVIYYKYSVICIKAYFMVVNQDLGSKGGFVWHAIVVGGAVVAKSLF